ncbi:MAG: hypothetical protein LBJ00_11115 [Planctomycetaceae bacterium]|jgi:hypothetical protein|nr:hypothetical protein [Planctomycetaceae bacterium]
MRISKNQFYSDSVDSYTQAVLKFLKLNTEAQQREAVTQGRSLPPIPAPVYRQKTDCIQNNLFLANSIFRGFPISSTRILMNFSICCKSFFYRNWDKMDLRHRPEIKLPLMP